MEKEYIRDKLSGFEYIPLIPEDTFSFECKLCGNCCRNVESAVPIETLDLFRIAKFLNKATEDVITEYTDTLLLAPNFPVLFMNTKGSEKECVFLKDNHCSIQDGKPRTCRMYPLSASPDNNGALEDIWVAKEHHRYAPGNLRVRDWMADSLSLEDREFLRLEYGYVREMGFLVGFLSDKPNMDILANMLIHRYFAYNTHDEFIPQYKNNMSMLLKGFRRLAAEMRQELN